MEWIVRKENIIEFLKKYRYLVLVLALGIFLMILPSGSVQEETQEPMVISQEEGLQEHLAQLLSRVEGAGKVEVLLTEAKGEQVIYQTDEDRSNSDTGQDLRKDTVLVNGTSREETGLVVQKNPPIYQGAIIVCNGADNAGVCLRIVQAVKSVTGLTSDKITVLKMK